jgi:hypothetical protein
MLTSQSRRWAAGGPGAGQARDSDYEDMPVIDGRCGMPLRSKARLGFGHAVAAATI